MHFFCSFFAASASGKLTEIKKKLKKNYSGSHQNRVYLTAERVQSQTGKEQQPSSLLDNLKENKFETLNIDLESHIFKITGLYTICF